MKPSQLTTSFGTKLALALGLIFVSGVYAVWQPFAGQAAAATAVGTQTTQSVPTSTPAASTPTSLPDATSTPAALPVTKPKSTGQYVDGTYTGSSASAYYGQVQVEAIIQNGQLADVKFLSYPSDRSTSRQINTQAMATLTSEAIQAQSAQVNGVSGASDTSAAFMQSLSSALAQAKN